MTAGGTKKGQFTSNREKKWMDPDREGGFQVSRQGNKGTRGTRGTLHICNFVPYMYAANE
jgi:hypothetical protein